MKQMIYNHGAIQGVYMACQLRNGIAEVKHWWNDGVLSWWQVRDRILENGLSTVYFVHFGNFKAFAEQMEFAKGTTLGWHMEKLRMDENLREK